MQKKLQAFDPYPEYFTKIYQGKTIIYQVNLKNINKDYPQ